MEAGRELDALIAEKVMGFRRVRVPKDYDGENPGETLLSPETSVDDINFPPKGHVPLWFFCPQFSTSIAAAWQVVQKLLVDNPYLAIERDVLQGNAMWKVEHREQWKDHDWQPVYADTAPLAICLAALETVKQH